MAAKHWAVGAAMLSQVLPGVSWVPTIPSYGRGPALSVPAAGPTFVQRLVTTGGQRISTASCDGLGGEANDQWHAVEVEILGIEGPHAGAQAEAGAQGREGNTCARQKRVDAFFDRLEDNVRIQRARDQEQILREMRERSHRETQSACGLPHAGAEDGLDVTSNDK